MAKEAYYFSHDANARHDDKILELRSEFGWEGYGLFWAIVETLRDCSNYSYPGNAKAGLALSLNIEKTKLEKFLKRAVDLGLFVEKGGCIYSESLMRRMGDVDEKRRKRAEAGRLGGKAKANAKQSPGNAKAKRSKESKVKKSKEEENKGILSLHQSAIAAFHEFYESRFNTAYLFNGAKDGTAVKSLLDKIRAKTIEGNLEPTDENILQGFTLLLQSITDTWVLDNLSPALLNSKFNETFKNAKNGTSKQTANSGINDYLKLCEERGHF